MNRNLLFSALFLFAAQQINAQDVTFGLVSKYTFDNQDVTDEVGANDGGAQDVSYASPGFGSSGSAIFFDGYDPNGQFQTVALAGVGGDIIDISQSFTISFWFNLTGFNPNRNMVLLSSRGNVAGQEAGGIEFTLNGADNTLNVYGRSISGGFTLEYQLTSPEIQNTLTWYFVTLTRNNAGSYKLYLNGSEVDELTTANVAEQNNLWSIGCTPNVPVREFQGSIDEVRFYDRVISSGEVNQL
ncbi:MAG: LamG domain-containing protein, partial [Flavobacteriales bacterium]